MNKPGIYIIRCIPSGRVYVGSSKDMKHRWAAHVSTLRKGKHSSGFLQRAWNKYGADGFAFEVIETVGLDRLVEREQFWMDQLKATSSVQGFNLAPTAGSLRGHTHTAESRERMAASKRGIKYRPRSPEHLAAISRANKGKRPSPETRALLSAVRKGKKKPPRSPEHSAAISAALKGKTLSPETRQKLSDSLKGRKRPPRSAAWAAALSQAHLARHARLERRVEKLEQAQEP